MQNLDLKALALTFVFYWMTTAAANCETSKPLSLRIAPKPTGAIEITLSNASGHALEYFDSLNANRSFGLPLFVAIRLRSGDGETLSVLNSRPDGYWTPLIRYGQIIKVPVNLTNILPQESVSTEVTVSTLVEGIEPSILEDASEFKIHCRVFLDDSLEVCLEKESDWIPLELSKEKTWSNPWEPWNP